jgi:TRAP-type C4-dicarboxylate transport system substrate-binding protein
MKALSRTLAVFLTAGLLCVAGVTVPGDAQAKIILKVATQSSRPGTPRADYLVHFKNGVAKRTNGEIEVQIYWANSLVHAKEALEAVQVGTADMADLAVAYFSDKIKLLQVGTLPFSVSDPVKARDGGMRLLREVPEALAELTKFGHVFVGMTATAEYHLNSRGPIPDLAALKGKKVGTFGRIAPKAIQAAGAIPVSTTGGEMYEALQRKTIDARILSFEAAQRFKTYEVAKYMSTIRMGAIAGINTFTINKKKWDSLSGKWDSLSKEHQKILLEEGERVGEWEAHAMRDGDAEFQKYLQGKRNTRRSSWKKGRGSASGKHRR